MDSIVINEMLKFACPSIQLRIRREFIREAVPEEELLALIRQIEVDSLVESAWNWSGGENWKKTAFHGYESIEAAIRIFAEKGLPETHPFLQSALSKLEEGGDVLLRGIGKPGISLDEANLGGSQMIRAYLFAHAGVENVEFVQSQIEKALVAFRFLQTVKSLGEVCELYRDYMVFKSGAVIPDVYLVRLLAFSQNWRSPENFQVVTDGIRKMVSWAQIPDIQVKVGSQVVAPGSFAMHDLVPDVEKLEGYGWMLWFHRMELFSRLGVLDKIPELTVQKQWLQDELDANDGWFTRKLKHGSFAKWGAYTGLRLEKDWRSAKRRMYDLTFRAGLILGI